MESSASSLPIRESHLAEFRERATAMIRAVSGKPRTTPSSSSGGDSLPFQWAQSLTTPETQNEKTSLLEAAQRVSGDKTLLSDETHHVLSAVRRALQIAMYIQSQYVKFSGLDTLMAQNSKGVLVDRQKAEFRDKHVTASAITLFVTAYYVVHELTRFQSEETSASKVELEALPDLTLQSPVSALNSALFQLAGHLLEPGSVRTNADFVKLTLRFFEAVLAEIQRRRESLAYTEPFTSNTYRLEGSEFFLDGFAADVSDASVSVEFNRVDLAQIVGNRDAKHKARRLASRLICYDPKTQRNPFEELGGLATVRMGYGKPGTGKSLQIAATATLLHDWCAELGIPFLFWPMPDTVVSTFQGGSAERMMNWMRPLKDPTRIVYAPIDDAENNLEERTRQGVSAGVREVIAVFLRNTEGAYAVNHGNAVIELFTNLPEQIDKAVLSRIIDRFAVDGARTWQDFLDQDRLWWQDFGDVDRGFVDMKDPKDYEYLTDQQEISSLARVYEGRVEPEEERVREVFGKVRALHDPNEHKFFAVFFQELQKELPYFSSRDVRNIQRLINERIMDFDLPDAWFENPTHFFGRPYDEKKNALVDLMRQNMKGLSFAEIRLQETVRYCDEFVRIAELDRERRLEQLVEQMQLQAKAQARLRGN